VETRVVDRMVSEFVGNVHVFASAVGGIMEEPLSPVARADVTVSQLRVLRLIASSAAKHISDVATYLGVSNAAASKGVDKLVRRKLLRRTEDQSDRRACTVTLTEAGRALLNECRSYEKLKLAQAFHAFPAEELLRTTDVLRRLSASLISHGVNPDDICLKCGLYFPNHCPVRETVGRRCGYARRRAGG
jgi:DNA-binding MarR family transcriptional regulator